MTKQELFDKGRLLVTQFCNMNGLPSLEITSITRDEWYVSACAFYRPFTKLKKQPYIHICLQECASPAQENQIRNWNWPGNTVDREPYGVLAHEAGHHLDWYMGTKKGSYFSEYSTKVMLETQEKPISSYCPNPAEWFAEMARLFITNAPLLKLLRPITYERLSSDGFISPCPSLEDWRANLLGTPPARIVKSINNKIRG